jgi:hypothetical protein
MHMASVFDWFARESVRAAEQTNDLKQREIFIKLAERWAAAARREEQSSQSTPPRNDHAA